MLLSDLIRGLPITVHGSADVRVSGVTEDSRRVEPGWLFVARPGTKQDGCAFVAQALERGAVAVLGRGRVDAAVSLVSDVPATVGAVLAERWFGSPSSRLGLVGITGTNGKTTVAWLLRHLMNAGGRKCGMIGTIEIDEGAGARAAELTTPAAEDVSASLARMVGHGCDAAAIEVSSHALDQGRTGGLSFRAGVFTNLSGDHLDYHGSMDAYAAAKARLFEGLSPDALAIVNVDDPASERMLRDCRARVLRCSMGGEGDATARVVAEGLQSRITMVGPWGEVGARLSLVGNHNAMNALQAVTAAHDLGLSREAIEAALPSLMPPPGRLEHVLVEGVDGPRVLVDYAHTDDALEKALTAVAGRTGEGKLWIVFGCGGDRDRTKRPRMGAVAGRLADRVVVTSDNPRTEEPRSILDQVLSGVQDGVWTASDVHREAAIHLAISQADAHDVVVIAGKGHEDYQIIPDGAGGSCRREFDDRVIARAALRKRSAVAGGVR
ncbi:MAG: UDP-N-acetylmuramoyl-L-alanyl-D-glutamate--2,6-diaminopimelate ligase [Phycisphaera sp.]|nr:MAG: UDP-N-acetylmuramoyl-L-alanyl-D-glutamate--2,6-diaminopimelate ligase [Phycisphaera sp.]